MELNQNLNENLLNKATLELKEPNLKRSSHDNLRENKCQNLNSVETNDSVAVLTGLHACGDLSCTTLKWFVSNPSIVGLCLISCCYHKMKGFPLSKTIDQYVFKTTETMNFDERLKTKSYSCLRSPFALRLASQEPFTR